MWVAGLGGVDDTLRVCVCFWPKVADVMALGAVVLSGRLVLYVMWKIGLGVYPCDYLNEIGLGGHVEDVDHAGW